MITGKRIRDLREKKGLTQKGLGDLVNKSAQVISNWERGYTPGISHDDILGLAISLNTTADYLLGRTNNPKPEEPDPKTREFFARLRKLSPESQKKILKELEWLEDLERKQQQEKRGR